MVFSFLCLVQLEKSREATDEANLRAAYAEVMASVLTETKANDDVTMGADGSATVTVNAVQADESGWVSGDVNIGGVKNVTAKKSGSSCTVKATKDGKVTIE